MIRKTAYSIVTRPERPLRLASTITITPFRAFRSPVLAPSAVGRQRRELRPPQTPLILVPRYTTQAPPAPPAPEFLSSPPFTMAPPLFEVPIAPQGRFVCYEAAPKVYLLAFTSPPDNRLTPAFNAAFIMALDIIEAKLPRGVVVTTSGIAKFYSNGLDLDNAMKTEGFMKDSLYPLWRRLITYPMPTLALLNGHAFAGGLITAMMHDYRIMNPHKGYVCMNELDFGMPLRPPMSSIFRQKLPRPDTYRTMVLESKRFNALESLKEGIVDTLGAWEETMKFIVEMKLVEKAASPVYGELKKEMWRETISYLEDVDEEKKMEVHVERQMQRDEEMTRKVAEFEQNVKSRSKL